MKFTSRVNSSLCAMALLVSVGLIGQAHAATSAAEPAKPASSGVVETIKDTTKKVVKATGKAAGTAADATAKVAKKAASTISGAGKAVDTKVPRTDAYKAKEKAEAASAAK